MKIKHLPKVSLLNVLLLSSMLSACGGTTSSKEPSSTNGFTETHPTESVVEEETLIEEEIIVIAPVEDSPVESIPMTGLTPSERVYIPPTINNLNMYLDADNIAYGYANSIQGGDIYEVILEEGTTFEKYNFEVSIDYVYAVKMSIYTGEYCVRANFVDGEVLFGDPVVDCAYSGRLYTQEEFTSIYGYLPINTGDNFVAHFSRDYDFVVYWDIYIK